MDNQSIAIVASPLVALMEDEVRQMTQRNVRAVYVGDADNGTEFEVCTALAYLSEQRSSFKQAARATRMTHDSDVIVIVYHARTKPWHTFS